MGRALFFRTSHLTNLMSHRDFLSAVKAGATNVRDNAILPPTASGDGHHVMAEGINRWACELGMTSHEKRTQKQSRTRRITETPNAEHDD
jgi:hypothetical protein